MCDVVFGGVFVRLAFLDNTLNALKLKCRFRVSRERVWRVSFVMQSHCVKSSRLRYNLTEIPLTITTIPWILLKSRHKSNQMAASTASTASRRPPRTPKPRPTTFHRNCDSKPMLEKLYHINSTRAQSLSGH